MPCGRAVHSVRGGGRMRRRTGVAIAVGVSLFAGCFGYERPRDRTHDAIGAPDSHVGRNGLTPLHRDRAPPPRELSRRDVVEGAREKITEVGRVRKRARDRITIERPTGDRVEMQVVPLTRITVKGRPANSEAVRNGAEVRASYVVRDGRRTAERIDVLPRD